MAAYALYNLSGAADMAVAVNNMATKTRKKLAETMSNAEIQAGQDLAQAMAKKGAFLKALDGYVMKPNVR